MLRKPPHMIVPHIIWGAQRVWTKGHPKNMKRPKVPISIAVGKPIEKLIVYEFKEQSGVDCERILKFAKDRQIR